MFDRYVCWHCILLFFMLFECLSHFSTVFKMQNSSTWCVDLFRSWWQAYKLQPKTNTVFSRTCSVTVAFIFFYENNNKQQQQTIIIAMTNNTSDDLHEGCVASSRDYSIIIFFYNRYFLLFIKQIQVSTVNTVGWQLRVR